MTAFIKRRQFVEQAAALGLMTSGWQRLLAAPVDSTEIHGHVVCGREPVTGVRVSDGYRVAATDDSGRFSIQVGKDSGPFLFITVPKDYWTNQFYLPTALAVREPPVFQLERRITERQYSAVYLTDVHLGEGRAEQSFAAFTATIDEINRLNPLPAVCWVGGDITLQGGKGTRYVELMSRLKMPVRNAVGNHEMLIRSPDPRARFGQLFGPTYYSFDIGKVHYITLDGCHVRPEADGYKNVEGLLSERELRWLAEDLQHVPDGMATVASIHIPLVSDYPARRGTTAAKVPWWIVRNADEVVDLLARHRVALVLQGHLHENQRSIRQGIEFVESISACGRWWKAPEGSRENGVSGEPRGYRILEINGSSIQHRYQSSAEARVDAIGEVVGRPANLAVQEDAVLAVNVFDPGPHTVVEGQLDGGPLERLLPGTKVRYHEDLEPAHHWTWTLSRRALTPGRHLLRLHVREPNGRTRSFDHLVTV
jgi:UDP-2,3-diacylglucosamine pyrophosphatase LpxH